MTTDERIDEIEKNGFSPDDVQWLVSELRRSRGALKELRLGVDMTDAELIYPSYIYLYCNQGLGT